MARLWSSVNDSPIERNAAVPGFAVLRKFVPEPIRARLIEICQSQLCEDWEIPKTRSGLSFSVQVACFGRRWTAHGYQPQKRPMPNEIVEWSSLAVNAVFQQYGSWTPQTAICNWYARNSKLGLHVDRQEQPHTLIAGLPIVTMSFGDDAIFGVRLDENDKLQKMTLEDRDVIVMGGPARQCEHGIFKITPGTGPKVGKATEGRLSITVRQVEI